MKITSGDKVAIIAPASQLRGGEQAMLNDATAVLESWGLRVDVRVENTHHFYLAGSDQDRASHLIASLVDPEIVAIFCTRGGYGSPRLLRYLSDEHAVTPKFLIGYSDITALHMGVNSLWPQIVRIHGPNVATKQFVGDNDMAQLNRQNLHDSLFIASEIVDETIDFIIPGVAQGMLEGGCLSLMSALVGTKYFPCMRNKILFLEDVGESPYRIDRMLIQLRDAGCLDGVSGIVFGAMHICSDPYNDLRDVLKDIFYEMNVPIGFGLRSGHGERNVSLRLGANAELNSNKRSFKISIPE